MARCSGAGPRGGSGIQVVSTDDEEAKRDLGVLEAAWVLEVVRSWGMLLVVQVWREIKWRHTT